jgi:acyl-CoA synthetase (NDP forming)
MTLDKPSHRDLQGLLAPRSIAVVGATDRPGATGEKVLSNIRYAGFTGEVLPINPGRDSVAGLDCYPDVDALPLVPDVGIITIPAVPALEQLEALGRRGVRNAVIHSAGFREVGGEGRELEHRLVEIADRYAMNVMGPNTVGATNFGAHATTSFSILLQERPWATGGLAIIGQSGSIPSAIHSMAADEGIGASHLIGSGNEAVLDVVDYLDHLIDDDATEWIYAYIEQIRRGGLLLDSVRRLAEAGKPLIVMRGGRTSQGSEAAASHTGAMAGDSVVADRLLREAGAVLVSSPEEAIAAVKILRRKPAAGWGRRAAIVAGSGGSGVAATDMAAEYGFEVPVISEAVQADLAPDMPAMAVLRNPIDLMPAGFSSPQIVKTLAEKLTASGEIDVVVIVGMYDIPASVLMASTLQAMAADSSSDPLIMWWGAGDAVRSEFLESRAAFIPNMTAGFAALDSIVKSTEEGRAPASAPGHAKASGGTGDVLTEADLKPLLVDAGLDVPASEVVSSLDELREAAGRVDFPVVMKATSPLIPHRSAVGALVAGVADLAGAEHAYRLIVERARAIDPGPDSADVLVESMIPAGKEIFVAFREDPSFGPILVVGLGGVITELANVVEIATLPADEDRVGRMVDELPLIGRAISVAQRSATIRTIRDAAAWWLERRQEIAEIELNPVLIHGERATIVDALGRRARSEVPA